MKTNSKLAEAMHLQAVEDNPLDADQVAMFEMFEQENWPQAKRLAYVRERSVATAMIPAAE